MVSIRKFREMALSFEGSEELPHFEKASFRLKKKIFASLNEQNNRACLKLNEIDQSIFCDVDRSAIYPVPNSWGKQGWTFFEIEKLPEELVHDALRLAYEELIKKKKK